MKVNFIGIGAQKCASTWVHRILYDHPEVAIYLGKEIDFFSNDYVLGYQWYEKQLGDVSSSVKAMGEISPSYFADSDTPNRVFLYNPDMKIVLSLRDPIERAYSNHLHQIRIGYFAGQDLDFDKGMKNNPMYLEQSRYAQHLARWLADCQRPRQIDHQHLEATQDRRCSQPCRHQDLLREGRSRTGNVRRHRQLSPLDGFAHCLPCRR